MKSSQNPFILLHFPQTTMGKLMNKIVAITTFFSLFLMIFDSVGGIDGMFFYQFQILQGIIIAIFTVEWGYRFWKSQDKKAFFWNIHSIIELMSFLPYLLMSILGGFIDLRFLWILRSWKFFSILRLTRYFEIIEHLHIAFRKHFFKFEIAFLAIFMIWLISGIVMYYVEGGINHTFDSIPNALRWSIVTMSTVGYGDMYPVTGIGKLFAGIILILGPIFLAIVSSLTVITFFDVIKLGNIKKNQRTCTKCFEKNHEPDANYCKICGTILPSLKHVESFSNGGI